MSDRTEGMTTKELIASGLVMGEVGEVLARNLVALEDRVAEMRVALEMDDPAEGAPPVDVVGLVEEVEHLREFKRLVHEALDAAGAPSHPIARRNAQLKLTGHRAVDRIYAVADSRDEWEKAATRLGEFATEMRRQRDARGA